MICARPPVLRPPTPSCVQRRRTTTRVRSRMVTPRVRSGKDELWALDFDGVICDSCGESSLSAWEAAGKVWPEVVTSEEAIRQKEDVMEKMRTVRPVVETGYENIVQIRCLLEGMDTEEMLNHWPTILGDCMEKWQLDRAELVDLFGGTRDAWMQRDLVSWLAPNRIYEGLPEALPLLMDRAEVYIVTTKQARFTHVLLRDMANVEFPMDRIISTTVSGQPKTEILYQLQQDHAQLRRLFIEDKLSTLDKVTPLTLPSILDSLQLQVCAEEALQEWKLFLADWGYNTRQERVRASRNPRIDTITLTHFASLLKNGVSSEVTHSERSS